MVSEGPALFLLDPEPEVVRLRAPGPTPSVAAGPRRQLLRMTSGTSGYETGMPAEQSSDILESLKKVAAALRDADIPFCVGGGLAAWARGGPSTEHDVDLLIREQDADRALELMARIGHASPSADASGDSLPPRGHEGVRRRDPPAHNGGDRHRRGRDDDLGRRLAAATAGWRPGCSSGQGPIHGT